jgi:hypothetical protein
MPAGYVRSLAKKHGMSTRSADAKWNKAKAIVHSQGRSETHPQFYALVTHIFKKMMGPKKHEEEMVETFVRKKIKIESRTRKEIRSIVEARLLQHDAHWRDVREDEDDAGGEEEEEETAMFWGPPAVKDTPR